MVGPLIRRAQDAVDWSGSGNLSAKLTCERVILIFYYGRIPPPFVHHALRRFSSHRNYLDLSDVCDKRPLVPHRLDRLDGLDQRVAIDHPFYSSSRYDATDWISKKLELTVRGCGFGSNINYFGLIMAIGPCMAIGDCQFSRLLTILDIVVRFLPLGPQSSLPRYRRTVNWTKPAASCRLDDRMDGLWSLGTIIWIHGPGNKGSRGEMRINKREIIAIVYWFKIQNLVT